MTTFWHTSAGSGDPVALLHGGFSDSRDFDLSLSGLSDAFTVHAYDRRGHGRSPDLPGPITMSVLAADAEAFLTDVVGGPAVLCGYSAGGAVALHTALRRPGLVRALVLISTAYAVDGMLFAPTADAPLPPAVVARYAEVSPDGPDHLPVIQAKLAESIATEPGLTPSDLARIACPTLVVAADDDLVTLEHTAALYGALPDARLAILPGTSHLLLLEAPDRVTTLVRDFLTGGFATSRLMPIRRR
ncbi:alpha/beta hydrolase [Dactylosporangium salmoneum]|uniref:Alpha/beta fold hydrolase n=1 Tax=Dactylosporangium salmoneum TaxID=53361 RepID=A0ABN3HFU5_9ACTN